MNYRNLFITICFSFITHISFSISLDSIPNPQFENWGNPLYSHDCPYEDYKTRKECAEQNILAFIQQNLIYPEDARENNIEGIVFIQFTIEADGTMSNFHIIREPHKSLGDEALRVLKSLPNKWEPGKRDGYYIKNGAILPVQFTLEVEDTPKKIRKRKRQKRHQKRN